MLENTNMKNCKYQRSVRLSECFVLLPEFSRVLRGESSEIQEMEFKMNIKNMKLKYRLAGISAAHGSTAGYCAVYIFLRADEAYFN